MKPSTRPYHHGHLRQALLRAAEVALEARGVQHLSLRELSRELGVSHASPQRHFATKQDLIDALAIMGFERLSSVVAKAGDSALLRQVYVHRAGHCAFTPAETITAAKVLLNRVRDGEWNALSLTPALLKARASALGPKYNVFSSNGTLVATPPAFLRFTPPRYLRPFDAPAP